MSNLVLKRKQQLGALLNSNEVSSRLTDLYGGDDKKSTKFKATLYNIALDKSLVNCDMNSIFKSALAIAEADLPISKQLGLAYIVPYGKEAQPIISYKGYKNLLRRDGMLIKAREIYTSDDFKMQFDGFDDIFHLTAGTRESNENWIKENLTGIWVSIKYIELNEVENFFVAREKLEQLSNMSKSKNSKFSPYNSGWWLEMMMGKAVGYIARKIGVSGDSLNKAFEIENSQTDLLKNVEVETGADIFDAEVQDLNGAENE